MINYQVIRKCMKYMNKLLTEDAVRNQDINLALEDYLSERRKYLFGLLQEIETYPASLQK